MSDITNFSMPTPSLYGRQEERVQLEGLLQSASRLITVTGAPGVGKTHLAATGAASQKDLFPDGIYYLNLAATRRWVILLGVIAEGLHLPISAQQPLSQLNEQLLNYLEDKRCLLFLDNFEHLLPGAVLLEQVLFRCPRVMFLVTSRIPLNSASEHLLELEPLATPTSLANLGSHPEQLLGVPAAELFVAMVQQHVPSFVLSKNNVGAIGKLCQELDGLPFALELAASQLEKHAPATSLGELSGPYLPNWEVSADPQYFQHSTLRDAWQWSYDLLSEKQRLVLRHAHLFAGSFSVGALSAVLGTEELIAEDVEELLRQLVSRHLATLENSHKDFLDEPRFRLFRLTRRFAYEQFERLDDIPQSHLHYLEYYQRQVESGRASEGAWLRLERPNLEVALDYIKDAYHSYAPSLFETLTTLLSAEVSSEPSTSLQNQDEFGSTVTATETTTPSDALTNTLGGMQQGGLEGRRRQKEPLHVQVPKELDQELFEELTEREQEVLRLVATGLSNREIAEELEVSPRTIGAHLANIFSKLNVKTRTAAVRKAVSLDLDSSSPRL